MAGGGSGRGVGGGRGGERWRGWGCGERSDEDEVGGLEGGVPAVAPVSEAGGVFEAGGEDALSGEVGGQSRGSGSEPVEGGGDGELVGGDAGGGGVEVADVGE